MVGGMSRMPKVLWVVLHSWWCILGGAMMRGTVDLVLLRGWGLLAGHAVDPPAHRRAARGAWQHGCAA